MGQKDSLSLSPSLWHADKESSATILMFDLAPETDRDDDDDPLIDVPRDRRNARHYAEISEEIGCDPLLKIVHAPKTRYEIFSQLACSFLPDRHLLAASACSCQNSNNSQTSPVQSSRRFWLKVEPLHTIPTIVQLMIILLDLCSHNVD